MKSTPRNIKLWHYYHKFFGTNLGENTENNVRAYLNDNIDHGIIGIRYSRLNDQTFDAVTNQLLTPLVSIISDDRIEDARSLFNPLEQFPPYPEAGVTNSRGDSVAIFSKTPILHPDEFNAFDYTTINDRPSSHPDYPYAIDLWWD